MWQMWLWLTSAHHIYFAPNQFSVIYRFPFIFWRLLPDLALLTESYLKKVLQRLTTDKNEKKYSWHVPAMKFIGKKMLV